MIVKFKFSRATAQCSFNLKFGNQFNIGSTAKIQEATEYAKTLMCSFNVAEYDGNDNFMRFLYVHEYD